MIIAKIYGIDRILSLYRFISLPIIAFFVFFIVLFIPIYVYTQETEQVRVMVGTANVRSGAGVDHPVLITVSMGSVFQVLDKVENWYKVRITPEFGTRAEHGFIHDSSIEYVEIETALITSEELEATQHIEIEPAYITTERLKATREDIRLFQLYIHDIAYTHAAYGQGSLDYSEYEFQNILTIGARYGIPLSNQVDLSFRLGFTSISPEIGDSRSGLTDVEVSSRYNVVSNITVVSMGGYLTLPIGDDEIGEGNTNFGIFGAIRHPVSDTAVITGTIGIDFLQMISVRYFNDFWWLDVEPERKRKSSLNLGGGVIFETSDDLNIVVELALMTEFDYAALSGGIDYRLSGPGRLRGSLILGLDDGAPDVALMFGYQLTF